MRYWRRVRNRSRPSADLADVGLLLDTPNGPLYGAAMLDLSKAIDLESLRLLEAKVEQFVTQHEHVREAHGALAQRLADKERELADATALLKRYEQERAELKARLERILSRLDGLDLS